MGLGDAHSRRPPVPRPLAEKPPATRAAPPGPVPGRPSAEPAVLVLGADEAFLPALRIALARHRVFVETAPVDRAVESVVVAAPDLVLLVGEAARDGGREVLSQLTASPVSSVVPVALLGDETALDERLRAFRHGATAVIPRSASIDAIAEHVARLAREIPERGGEALGVIGEATLNEFVNTLKNELRSGILSVQSTEHDAPVRLVLGSGRPLAKFIDDFVRRARAHVVHAEPLRYEFDDRAGGTVQLLGGDGKSEAALGSVSNLRLVLADDDPARADVVAQELRARGALVTVTGFEPDDSEFARLRQTDPEVLIIGEREVEGAGYSLLKRMKRDTRLRWASLLVVRWHEVWGDALTVPAIDRLTGTLAALADADRGLLDRAELGDAFDARLEVNGPARCLRALAACKRALRLSVYNARVFVEVDVSDGLVVGARASAPSGEQWEGGPALAALLVLSSGRVHVVAAQQPATTNMMATVDVALNLAESEPAPIVASLPAGPPSDPPVSASGTAMSRSPAPPRGVVPLAAHARVKGVSPLFAAILVALAVIQGLLLAVLLNVVFRRRDAAATAEVSASARPAAASARPVPQLDPKPAPAASSAPAAQAVAPTNDAGSGSRAPSCDELLAGVDVRSGEYPGAAYEQLKVARRSIVQGDLDEAQRAYCKAVRWDSGNLNLHLELAQLLLLRRDGAGTAEWAQKGVRLDPSSTKAHSLLGDGLARLGDHDGARRAWFAAAKVHNPSPPEVNELTGRNLEEAEDSMAQRDYARAERFFRRAALLAPANASAALGLSNALSRLREHDEALDWARRAAKLAPSDALTHLAVGDALVALGDPTGAREQFAEADRLGHPDAKRRLGRLARESGASAADP